jgi:hypothetical protein
LQWDIMNSHAEQLDVGKMEEKSKASIVKSKHDTDVLEHVGKLLHKHLQKYSTSSTLQETEEWIKKSFRKELQA